MEITLSLTVTALFSIAGFARQNSIAFMLAAGSSMMLAFSLYDYYDTPAALGVSLMIWAYSIACAAFAFICMFKRGAEG